MKHSSRKTLYISEDPGAITLLTAKTINIKIQELFLFSFSKRGFNLRYIYVNIFEDNLFNKLFQEAMTLKYPPLKKII